MYLLSFNSLQKREHFNTFNNTYIYITITYSTPPPPKATKDNKKQNKNRIMTTHGHTQLSFYRLDSSCLANITFHFTVLQKCKKGVPDLFEFG